MRLATSNKLYALCIKASAPNAKTEREKKNRGSRLELEPRSELQHSRPAAAETWITLRDVRRLRREAAGTLSQGLLKCEARSSRRGNHAAGQRKLRMIENVEEFGAKLKIQPLGQLRVLRQRKINIPKAGAVDGVATKIPEIACGRGEGEGIDVAVRGIAAKDLVNAGNDVRPLMKVIRVICIENTVRRDDPNRLTGHDCNDCVPAPSFGEPWR